MNTTALISPAIKFRIYELNSTKNLGVLVFFFCTSTAEQEIDDDLKHLLYEPISCLRENQNKEKAFLKNFLISPKFSCDASLQ